MKTVSVDGNSKSKYTKSHIQYCTNVRIRLPGNQQHNDAPDVITLCLETDLLDRSTDRDQDPL